MSQKIYKVGWFYLLILILLMVACSSLTELPVSTVSAQELRQGFEAMPAVEPTHEQMAQNKQRQTTIIPATEPERIRMTMQQAWREIFLPTQPYQATIAWTQLGHFGGLIDYQVIAFDKLSAEVEGQGKSYRCVQDGEKSFFTMPSLKGVWVSALSENQVNATGSHIHIMKVCNASLRTFLVNGADPFSVINNRTPPSAGFYPLVRAESSLWFAEPMTIDDAPIVGYRMIRGGARIDIWLNEKTGQPLLMKYANSDADIYWRLTGLLDKLLIETPQVTQ